MWRKSFILYTIIIKLIFKGPAWSESRRGSEVCEEVPHVVHWGERQDERGSAVRLRRACREGKQPETKKLNLISCQYFTFLFAHLTWRSYKHQGYGRVTIEDWTWLHKHNNNTLHVVVTVRSHELQRSTGDRCHLWAGLVLLANPSSNRPRSCSIQKVLFIARHVFALQSAVHHRTELLRVKLQDVVFQIVFISVIWGFSIFFLLLLILLSIHPINAIINLKIYLSSLQYKICCSLLALYKIFLEVTIGCNLVETYRI